MEYKLIFIGFGTVGQGLMEILNDKKDWLELKFGFAYKIVAVSDKLKGAISNKQGLDEKKLFDLVRSSKKLDEYPEGIKALNAWDTIAEIDGDIVIETTYTDL